MRYRVKTFESFTDGEDYWDIKIQDWLNGFKNKIAKITPLSVGKTKSGGVKITLILELLEDQRPAEKDLT